MKKVFYIIPIKILVVMFLLMTTQVSGDTVTQHFTYSTLKQELVSSKKEKLGTFPSKGNPSLEGTKTTKNESKDTFSCGTNFYIDIAIGLIILSLAFIRFFESDQKKYSKIYEDTIYLKKFK